MKVGDLRKKLGALKKEEVVQIASEFYKVIPKAKKEDYNIDELVNNPGKKKKKSSSKTQMSLSEIGWQISEFTDNARNQYYMHPNRIVPKKERATWRFKVKRWYKELINTNRSDADIGRQALLLTELYELICESCAYIYFTAYDSFESIGIEQSEFYKSLLMLIQEAEGKKDSVEKGIRLIVENPLNRYTLYSTLMEELIPTLDLPDLKYEAIEKTKFLLKENNFNAVQRDKNKTTTYSSEHYEKKKRNNNLAELGLRLYSGLYELDEGVAFFKKHYYESRKEIKIYVLVRILFSRREKDRIIKEIEDSMKAGIEPRKELLDLLNRIRETGVLPKYMR